MGTKFHVTVSCQPRGRVAQCEQFKAKAGWTLITGDKDEIDGLLRVLTGDGINKDLHAPLLSIVNDAKKTHRRAYGLEDPAQVIRLTDELAK